MAGSSERRRFGPLSEWTATPADETIDQPVGQLLARQVAAYPERRALYWPEGDSLASMTYAEPAVGRPRRRHRHPAAGRPRG